MGSNMTVAGLIFSNIHDSAMPELTSRRTIASVPFGCRYRLIDFPLSNMVNAGITKVGVITHNNYQSLVDHIGTGKDWDLARRSGGIKILPPFITAYDSQVANKLYNTRLEALIGVRNFISKCNEDCIVMSDCDGVFNIDLDEVLDTHEENGAKMTIVTTEMTFDGADVSRGLYSLESNFEGNVVSVRKVQAGDTRANVSTNVIVANRLFLLNLLNDAASRGYTDFYRDVVERNMESKKIFTYKFDGTYILINSLRNYFSASMELLDSDTRNELFGAKDRPIHTKVRNSAPTVYANGAEVKNSYVADGCVIEGKVENCIIFRGVKIGKGTVVKNCVLLQDTKVGNNVTLNCVVTDKDVTVNNGRMLSGHETMPFFLSKGTEV